MKSPALATGVVLTALAAFCLPLEAAAPGSRELLSNGDFAQSSEHGALPAFWEAQSPQGVALLRDENPPVLRLAASGPGQAPAVRQEAALPHPLPDALLVVADVRMENVQRGGKPWHSGRILVTYLDDRGNTLGETFTLDRLQGDSPWKMVSRQFPALPGAVKVRLELQLLNAAAGRISFRNVSLRALDAREAQAWRGEADERIRKFRTAPLRVRVEDAGGRPLPNADVAVFMRLHAYPFGTAVKTRLLLEPPGDPHGNTYRAVVENFFNYATLENELKATHIEKKGLDEPLRALAWLKERGLARRGHVLTWPSYQMSAKAVAAASDDPDKVRALMKAHFHNVLTATAPANIVDWDVVNEPAVHTDLISLLGEKQVAEWFRWAREDAPDARLFVNENNVEFQGGNRDSLEKWLRFLRDAGAPLGGIGWQGHMWHRTLPSGQNILADLDHFAAYGLPIQITEYDTDARFSDGDDARFLDEFLTAWFSHPLTAGFIMWGFQDSLIWNGNAPLFRDDWSLKPSGRAWMDLVFGKWWTEETGRTGRNGEFETRGFLGTHDVEVRHDGKRAVRRVELSKDGADITIRLGTSSENDEPATRLVSSNPYLTGKLPARLEPKKQAGATVTRAVNVTAGVGAWAVSSGPAGEGGRRLVLRGSEDARNRRDIYLRFDAGSPAKDSVVEAALALEIAEASSGPLRLQFHVLSHRFVPQGGEAGLDWKPMDVASGRAPGRDPGTGQYRLGDAAVVYLGEETVENPKAGTRVRFSSPDLARAVQAAGGKGITVIISTSGDRLIFAGPEDGSRQPSMEIKLRK
jgi:GH35 family endo-1,4-beta-xylanase